MKYFYGLVALLFIGGVWTQWFSPLQVEVIEIINQPATTNSGQFQHIRDTVSSPASENDWLTYIAKEPTIQDIEGYNYITYVVEITNWRLKNIVNLQSRLLPSPQAEERFQVQVREPFYRSVPGTDRTSIVCHTLMDTKGLTPEQIEEMIKNVTILVSWDDFSGPREMKIQPK